jgi:hypothetical protein
MALPAGRLWVYFSDALSSSKFAYVWAATGKNNKSWWHKQPHSEKILIESVKGVVMNNNPLAILNRFPDKHHLMIHRMTEDPEFYALCQDYEICLKALRYWTASNDPEASDRLVEYRTLVRELEAEIMDDLKSSNPQPSD